MKGVVELKAPTKIKQRIPKRNICTGSQKCRAVLRINGRMVRELACHDGVYDRKTARAVKNIDSQEDILSTLFFRKTTRLGVPRVVVRKNKMCVTLNKIIIKNDIKHPNNKKVKN